MADYYSLLHKTIGKLANNTPENRRIVYGKARAAIDRKLRTMEPVPSEEAIARQMELLEDAIEKMEADCLAGGAVAASEQMAQAPVQHQQERVVEPAPQPAPPPPAPPIPEAVAAVVHEEPPVEASAPGEAGDAINFGSEEPSGASLGHDPVFDNPPEPYAEAANQDNDPAFAAHHDEGHLDITPDREANLNEPPQVSAEEADLAPPPMPDVTKSRKRKMGGLGKLIVILLVIGAIGGGGYWLWKNYHAQLTGMVSGGADRKADSADMAKGEAEKTAPAAQKENVRLGDNGETVEADPVEASDTSEPVKEDAPVILDQDNANMEPSTTDGQQANATPQDNAGASVVADRALLYTEVAGGQGANVTNGNVVWKLEGTSTDPVIHADMDVPDKGLVMTLDIKRNLDASISASHLINLQFQVPEDFDGRNVDNVARFVMKKSEQAVGEPLIGVPAKIVDGSFIIALDNLDKATKVNETLLLNSTWVDIPLVFSTGARALVTLEKGTQGEEVFNKAFAAWNKS